MTSPCLNQKLKKKMRRVLRLSGEPSTVEHVIFPHFASIVYVFKCSGEVGPCLEVKQEEAQTVERALQNSEVGS